jgi:methionyl-tRNA synthetase
VLYVTAEVLRQVGIMCQPFMPTSAGKLLDLLGLPQGERRFDRLGSADRRLAAGMKLPAPAPVFPRYVEPEAAKA